MNSRLKKIALATAVSAAMGTVSLPSHAYVLGTAGEALLVPLAVWDFDASTQTGFNTLVEVEVPGSIGWEPVAKFYTARHTTPTNAALTLTPMDPDLTKDPKGIDRSASINQVKWFWFDHNSKKQKDGILPVTADDILQINVRDALQNSFEGEPGYLVISTRKATTRQAADFNMFGDAWLVFQAADVPLWSSVIPVLPMSDDADGTDPNPSKNDGVKYNSNGVPTAVSPLASGMLTNYADGVQGDLLAFDIALSSAGMPSIHVIWTDEKVSGTLGVDVFDTDENTCSDVVPVDGEVNVLGYDDLTCDKCGASQLDGFKSVLTWVKYDPKDSLCWPTSPKVADEFSAGFVRYYMPEYADRGTNNAEYAGVAFGLKFDQIGVGEPDTITFSTILGHTLGMFK